MEKEQVILVFSRLDGVVNTEQTADFFYRQIGGGRFEGQWAHSGVSKGKIYAEFGVFG